MSIQERHNKNIETGLKISELRTRPPKIKPPFRVYTYESGIFGRNKVVNEWICKSMTEWRICMGIPATLPRNACVSVAEIRKYSGKDYKNITEMKISDLKIYDKPKELGEFTVIFCSTMITNVTAFITMIRCPRSESICISLFRLRFIDFPQILAIPPYAAVIEFFAAVNACKNSHVVLVAMRPRGVVLL